MVPRRIPCQFRDKIFNRGTNAELGGTYTERNWNLNYMKKKINYLQFKKKLEDTRKDYFTFQELKKFYPHDQKNLSVLLSHWTQKGLIYHLGQQYYTFNLANLDYLRLASSVDKNSYVSFEYALYFYNLINQVPSVVTCATKKRSRKISLGNWIFEYTRLKLDLFFGYELKDKIYIATPEKALADLLYLMSRGKRTFEWANLEKEKINHEKLQKVLKNFPSYTQQFAKKMGLL